MSEKYVREILEKLEEIEKLHAKLRSLVPRVKNYKSENNPNAAKERSMNMENKQSVAKETNGNKKDSREQKPVDFRRGSETLKNTIKDSTTRVKKLFEPNTKSMRYFEKFRDQSKSKLGNFRRNSIDYVTKQWYEQGDKIKYLLSTVIEPDIILANRASQTSDDDLAEIVVEKKFPILSPKKRKLIEKRRSTLQDLSERQR
ncbi:uncharacterized protein LOC143426505 [Xylocopa sonorina]|uniref:uncharacterized protein LOC143426505 n=1 Tax=Xylocopa sonorina TaxID=1818115 RepID=UPI00403B0279